MSILLTIQFPTGDVYQFRQPSNLVGAAGFEPATSDSQSQRSTQTELYSDIWRT